MNTAKGSEQDESVLRDGTAMEVVSYASRIASIPSQPMESLRGIFEGMDTAIDREEDRL